jgi:membrane associated rhomboid family serine protease
VNDEGIAPVLCDRCAGVATSRARRTLATGTMRDFPATVTLMAINLTVYVGMVFTGHTLGDFKGQELVNWGGNYGPFTAGGEYWRLVTAGFVHANFLHIALNMWCLYSLGRLSERLFGKWQTFFMYLLTGVGGALLSIHYAPERLSVGASGAVFGIAGALIAGLKFGELPISLGERRATLSSVAVFVVISLIWGAGSAGTDNMCHLGGFVTGLLIGLPLGAFARNHKLYQVATLVVTALVLSAAGNELVQTNDKGTELYRARLAASQQDYPKAIRIMEKYTAAKSDDEQAWLLLGDLYVVRDEKDKAIAAFEHALEVNPNSEDAQGALQVLRGGGAPHK